MSGPINRGKIVYSKTVAVEGLYKRVGSFIEISTDNGKTWTQINQSNVHMITPTR